MKSATSTDIAKENAKLKKLLSDLRPGLAVYASQQNVEWWLDVVARVDSALGYPPACLKSNRSA